MNAKMDNEVTEAAKEQERRLQTYFHGRRQAMRTCTFLEFEVSGAHDKFRGMAVDISRTGALIRILDESFAEQAEVDQLMLYTARVWYHFENGLGISFLDGKVAVTADVVRVSGYCGQGQGLNLIGIHFRTELSEEECEVLGIEFGADRATSGPLAD